MGSVLARRWALGVLVCCGGSRRKGAGSMGWIDPHFPLLELQWNDNASSQSAPVGSGGL